MTRPFKLINQLDKLHNNPLIYRLMISGEIALRKKYGYPFAAIPYIASQKNNSNNIDVVTSLVLRHAGNNMLLFNECLAAIQGPRQENNFGLIALNENIRFVLKEMMDLKRAGTDIITINKKTNDYIRLCEAAHVGWASVVLSDYHDIMEQIKKCDRTLYQTITDFHAQLQKAISSNQNYAEVLNALNDTLNANKALIEQYTAKLVLCGPQRKLRTLGNAYALAITEYEKLSTDEQEKDQVLVNGVLIELEIIYLELNHVPGYSQSTLNHYDATYSQPAQVSNNTIDCSFQLTQ